MMRKSTFLLLTAFTFLVFSCKHREVKKEMLRFMGQEIVFPRMEGIIGGKDTLLTYFLDGGLRLVVFYDPALCSSCHVGRMPAWQDMIDHAEETQGALKIIFVFSPATAGYGELRSALYAYPIDYPVFIDVAGEFQRLNPSLPANRMFHAFLLDKNNKVALVGDPSYNPALWKLYKEQIQKLLKS
jgi:hypothetical protein